jgi:hypothetical protein
MLHSGQFPDKSLPLYINQANFKRSRYRAAGWKKLWQTWNLIAPGIRFQVTNVDIAMSPVIITY